MSLAQISNNHLRLKPSNDLCHFRRKGRRKMIVTTLLLFHKKYSIHNEVVYISVLKGACTYLYLWQRSPGEY